jgi:hypothetical protein
VSIRERLAALDRIQKKRGFKFVASGVVLLVAVAVLVSYVVAMNAPGRKIEIPDLPPDVASPTGEKGGPATPEQIAQKNAFEASRQVFADIIRTRQDPTAFAVGVGVITALLLAVVWLGLGLTYLALGVALGLLYAGTASAEWMSRTLLLGWLGHVFRWLGATQGILLVGGLIALTAAFIGLMRVLQVAFNGPGPVFAIARNVLTEAVRLKISLVFLVLLILGLATLPLLMDAGSPLRYRVQGFLQYGTGISYWIIALLVVLLGVSSVTFEQRDRIIWQTMTKPVAAWQYLLGKWLGVVGVGAVLLAVCASGVFLFTEHLRGQRAVGEIAPYTTSSQGELSTDRLILETQVLTARVATRLDLNGIIDEAAFGEAMKQRIELERSSNPDFGTPADLARMDKDLRAQVTLAYRTIEPGENEIFRFTGLQEAKRLNRPLTFRFKVDSGSNAPDRIYKITFQFSGHDLFVQESALGQMQSITLLPTVVADDGSASVLVANGDMRSGLANSDSITFPPEGLELSYAASGFRSNFLRVVLVLWVKLAFMAMVAVCASTFLSFPVAALVVLGVFFTAETAPFLLQSLETYSAQDDHGKVIWYKVVVRGISLAVGYMFKIYGDLRPTKRLVEGELLPFGSVALALGVLGAVSAGLYALGVVTFRRRELAIYSGH